MPTDEVRSAAADLRVAAARGTELFWSEIDARAKHLSSVHDSARCESELMAQIAATEPVGSSLRGHANEWQALRGGLAAIREDFESELRVALRGWSDEPGVAGLALEQIAVAVEVAQDLVGRHLAQMNDCVGLLLAELNLDEPESPAPEAT